MCCQPETQRYHSWKPAYGCGCGGSFGRRFISPEEERERLKEYKEQLKKEQEEVTKRIGELEGK